MRIALIDVDGHNFPNLPLMKLSAWHKANGDSVEWYKPIDAFGEPYDICYKSKVFTFTDDYPYEPNANVAIGGVPVIITLTAESLYRITLSISIRIILYTMMMKKIFSEILTGILYTEETDRQS